MLFLGWLFVEMTRLTLLMLNEPDETSGEERKRYTVLSSKSTFPDDGYFPAVGSKNRN